MEKISVSDIIFESWRLSGASWKFFVYGFLLALPSAALVIFLEQNAGLSQEELSVLVLDHLWFFGLFLLWYIVSLLTGKSHLIALFQKYTKEKKSNRLASAPRLGLFLKALRIDVIFFSFGAVALFVLGLPSLWAGITNHPSLPTLLFLYKLMLILLLAIGYFLREFTYLYFLLSPLSLKGSCEAGINLCLQRKVDCFRFGVAFLFLALLFTFLFNFGMLYIVALSETFPILSQKTILFFSIFLILGWYEIFRQALWFRFFQSIAKPKNPVPENTVPTLEKKIEEMPAA